MITACDDISVNLSSDNVCENVKMSITRQVQDGGEEFFFTLHGTKDGKRIQYDFNELKRSELEDISIAISLLLELKLKK